MFDPDCHEPDLRRLLRGSPRETGEHVRYTYSFGVRFRVGVLREPSFAVKPPPESDVIETLPDTTEAMIELALLLRSEQVKSPSRIACTWTANDPDRS